MERMATGPSSLGIDTRKVDRLLAHYGESHRNPRNERIHFVAIPFILVSLLGLLWAAHPWLALLFVAASLVYYARLSLVFLAAMAAVSVIGLLLVRAMGPWVLPLSGAIFVAAWIKLLKHWPDNLAMSSTITWKQFPGYIRRHAPAPTISGHCNYFKNMARLNPGHRQNPDSCSA